MATTTPNINLTLPANGEFVDTWDIPVNGNFIIIDTEIQVNRDDLATHISDTTSPHGDTLTQVTLNINRSASESGNAIDIINPTSNNDIDGNNSNWFIDSDGNATFNSITISPTSPVETLSFTREEKIGADGTGLDNKIFTLTNPYTVGDDSLTVYKDGTLQREGLANDYVETDNTTVTFNDLIGVAERITFDIGRKTNASFGSVFEFVAAGGEVLVSLPFTYTVEANQIDVYRNGSLQSKGNDYTESGQDEITFVGPLVTDDLVIVRQARDSLASAHAALHEAGGSDEINLDGMEAIVPGGGIILKSSGGFRFLISVDDGGSLITSPA